MIQDARDVTQGSRLEADVCIAGAGAAGITIALALQSAGLTVCLLESGGFDPEDATQALYEGSMTGLQTWHPRETRGRLFGGSTQLWAGWCRPLLEDDFEARPWIPGSGWPIGLAELVPYYERAHTTLQLGAFDYDAEALSAATQRPRLPLNPHAESRIYQYSPPTRFGTRFRSALDTAPDIDVYLHANVVDIELAGEQLERVGAVSCKTLEGSTFSVEATAFVLALGGLENARILLAANRQRSEGVANTSDAVGRYFMEHPHYYSSVLAPLSVPLDLSFYDAFESDVTGVATSYRGAIGVTSETRAREGLPSFTATIAVKAVNGVETGPLATDTVASLTHGASEGVGLRFTIRAEQTPTADSRVTLGADRDALGMPRLALDWRIRDEDDVAMRRSWEIIGAGVARAGLGRLWTPTDNGRFRWQPRPGSHHVGTTRMGDDPSDSVVDASCRCHDLDNLYLGGSSVFRTGGDSNPTLTIVALAHRLADHLAERLS